MGFYLPTTEIAALGTTPNNGNQRGIITGAILLPAETVYAGTQWSTTVANLPLEATLEAHLIAKRAFPMIGVKETEAKNSEDIIYTSPTGEIIDMSRGKMGMSYKLFLDDDQIKTIYTWEGKNWDIVDFDSNNNLYFRKDGSDYKGFTVSRLKVMTVTKATKDTPAWVIVELQEDDQNQRRDFEVVVKAAFPIKSTAGVLSVTATYGVIGVPAANKFVATVNYVSTTRVDSTGAYETVPITGLAVANFYVYDTTGTPAVETVTGVVEAPNGTYTVTCTAFTGGTCRIVPTSGFLYESATTILS